MTALVAIGAGLMVVACCKSKAKQHEMGSMAMGSMAASASAHAPAAVAVASEATAKKYFKHTCTVCHGADGKGDGPGAASMKPKPQDFTDAKWQAGVQDDLLKKVIIQGGASAGKSPLMPGHPDLKKKPALAAALVKLIRGFKK